MCLKLYYKIVTCIANIRKTSQQSFRRSTRPVFIISHRLSRQNITA